MITRVQLFQLNESMREHVEKHGTGETGRKILEHLKKHKKKYISGTLGAATIGALAHDELRDKSFAEKAGLHRLEKPGHILRALPSIGLKHLFFKLHKK